jgi:hypothetical protein
MPLGVDGWHYEEGFAMPRVRRRKQIKLGMSVDEAEESSGVSRATLYQAMEIAEHPEKYGPHNPPKTPPLPSIKVTSRRIILVDDLRDWLLKQRIPPVLPASTIMPLLLVGVVIHHFGFWVAGS